MNIRTSSRRSAPAEGWLSRTHSYRLEIYVPSKTLYRKWTIVNKHLLTHTWARACQPLRSRHRRNPVTGLMGREERRRLLYIHQVTSQWLFPSFLLSPACQDRAWLLRLNQGSPASYFPRLSRGRRGCVTSFGQRDLGGSQLVAVGNLLPSWDRERVWIAPTFHLLPALFHPVLAAILQPWQKGPEIHRAVSPDIAETGRHR